MQDGELLVIQLLKTCHTCYETEEFVSKIGKKVYHLVCLLHYIPEQKYVIANSTVFSDQESNVGEKVQVITIDGVGIAKHGAHCSIRCDNGGHGKFYLQPLNGYRVFINKEKINGQRRLRFGDTIFFGYIPHGPGMQGRRRGRNAVLGYHNHHMTLLFKKRQLMETYIFRSTYISRSLKIHRGNPYTPNPVIIKHISRYLAVPDLKCARLTCKLWNTVVGLILRKRTHASFHISEFYNVPTQSLRFFSYVADRVNLPNLYIFVESFIDPKTETRFLQNFVSFVALKEHKFTKLTLHTDINLCNGNMLFKILEFLAPNLVELCVGLYLRSEENGGNVTLPMITNLQFPLLRRLAISVSYTDDPPNDSNYPLIKRWTYELISVLAYNSNLVSVESQAGLILHSMVAIPVSRWACLNEIILSAVGEGDLEILARWPYPLKKLSLGELLGIMKPISYSTYDPLQPEGELATTCNSVIAKFKDMLRKMSVTLEELQFKLDAPLSRTGPFVFIRIPVMRSLRKLNIEADARLSYEDGEGIPQVGIKFCVENCGSEEERDSVIYAEQFPSLQSLGLRLNLGRGTAPLLEQFFPQNSVIFKSLVQLEITDGLRDIEDKQFPIIMARAAVMFPNVHANLLERVRIENCI